MPKFAFMETGFSQKVGRPPPSEATQMDRGRGSDHDAVHSAVDQRIRAGGRFGPEPLNSLRRPELSPGRKRRGDPRPVGH